MPSPGSPAHRARCATRFSPPWSTLRVTMPSGGHVITVSSLPSARAKSGDSSNLFDLEACPSDLLTRPIGADGHLRVGSVDRHRDPEEELQRLSASARVAAVSPAGAGTQSQTRPVAQLVRAFWRSSETVSVQRSRNLARAFRTAVALRGGARNEALTLKLF